eukprot:6488613-Amphidinium_carterae.1
MARRTGNSQMQYVLDGGGQAIKDRARIAEVPNVSCPCCGHHNPDYMHQLWSCGGHPVAVHPARVKLLPQVSEQQQALW